MLPLLCAVAVKKVKPVQRTEASAAVSTVAKVVDAYGTMSMKPLHVLVFLLPLIVMYEIGSVWYLADPSRGVVETIGARSMLSRFFEMFGPLTFYLPGAVLIVVFFMWHLFTKDKWQIRPTVIGGMLLESLVWCLPLLVIGTLLMRKPLLAPTVSGALHALPWQARLTLSVGAGLYEELLFRLVLITLIHFLTVDVIKTKAMSGNIIAILISAVLFSLYHHNAVPMNDPRAFETYLFYAIAGAYFGAIFLVRGFGIAVGCHALYDAIVLVGLANNGK